ncbi:MAG: hypothetical protein JSU63_10215 [Phycisphaerales bacterium]|nr:MAG: hypothetical protein JSU63_10215 [Phycisphaerales bacterium]
MKRLATIALMLCLFPGLIRVDETLEKAVQQDLVLRALVDELERGKVGLKLEDLEQPYFIEYALHDATRVSVAATLGAVTRKNVNHSRRLRTDLRVGSYELDNTNFSGRGYGWYFGGGFGPFGEAQIPIEDDYGAIRQAIWWSTDRKYKEVIEQFAKKKAFMESKVIEDKPNDFSREEPTTHVEERIDVAMDVAHLENLALELSQFFRETPQIKHSGVTISGKGGNSYLVNTEGTRMRAGGVYYSVAVNATVQADDGMELSDSISIDVNELAQLPELAELTDRCSRMIQQLIALKSAPKLESYTGPILFEPKAAAAIFSKRFADKFTGGQRAVGSRANPEDLANKLNKRILPRFMDVVDDPTQETIAGVPVIGNYEYDHQGVPAKPLKLVEKGRLKKLVMSRNPSKEFSNSTGHGRGPYRVRSAIGCVVVTAEPGMGPDELKSELLEACEDEDLEFGIRVASLSGAAGYNSHSFYGFGMGFGFGGYGRGGSNPLVMYKVFPDGREELVRGSEFAAIDLKAFKRILAAGNTPYVLNTGGGTPKTVAVPALLFEELDLAKIDRDFDKPPILPTPLARGGGK